MEIIIYIYLRYYGDYYLYLSSLLWRKRIKNKNNKNAPARPNGPTHAPTHRGTATSLYLYILA